MSQVVMGNFTRFDRLLSEEAIGGRQMPLFTESKDSGTSI